MQEQKTSYYQRNREKKLKYQSDRRKLAHTDLQLREKMRGYQRAKNRRLRQRVFEVLGRACSCCGESNACFLAFDHIAGNGNHERKALKRTGNAFYYIILREPERFQTLCHNCNIAKHIYDVCPHQEAACNAA